MVRDFFEKIGVDIKIFIIIGSILILTLIFNRIVRWLINRSYKRESHKFNLDPTTFKFFKNAASLIIWTIAFGAIIYTVPRFKAIAVTLFASAGVMVLIIGLAAQQAFSNIISGVFIVIFKPFRVGDLISIGVDLRGIVEDITLRHTVIKNFENKRIIIPNSIISSETVINDSIGDPKICRWIEVGISYDSDVDKAIEIIREIAEKHPLSIDNRSDESKMAGNPKVEVKFIGFGDSSINLKAYVWTDNPLRAFEMHCDINKAIKKRFDAEGIEIPFPYRTLVFKDNDKKEEHAIN
jgi:small conductance mechanosensitive channel